MFDAGHLEFLASRAEQQFRALANALAHQRASDGGGEGDALLADVLADGQTSTTPYDDKPFFTG